jgi:hypothetical protein
VGEADGLTHRSNDLDDTTQADPAVLLGERTLGAIRMKPTK